MAERFDSQMPPRIPANEVDFHPHSFCDPGGRLFRWEGEIYRGITPRWSPLLRRLLQSGIVSSLVDRGLLIDTKLVPWVLDGYESVLWHRSVQFPSYPNEWCPPMFKQAVVTILDLTIELAGHGLTLQDAHPWNLLIDGTAPVYVDLTSIAALRDESVWPAQDEFNRFCLYPLLLMSHGYDRIARGLLATDEGVLPEYVDKLARASVFGPTVNSLARFLTSTIRSRLRRLMRIHEEKSVRERLCRLRSEIQDLGFPYMDARKDASAPMSSQQSGSLEDPMPSQAKQKAITQVIERLQTRTLLGAGRDHACYALAAARSGMHAVTFSSDISEVATLHRTASKEQLPVLPLVMDIAKPTPSMGIGNHWFIAAAERLQCETVLALDVVQELVSRRHLDFRRTIECVTEFASKWLLIEWDESWRPEAEEPPLEPNSLEHVVVELRKRFREVRVIESHPAPSALLICEK